LTLQNSGNQIEFSKKTYRIWMSYFIF